MCNQAMKFEKQCHEKCKPSNSLLNYITCPYNKKENTTYHNLYQDL